MRLIDGDELKTAFPSGETVKTECVRATIDHMATIDAAPVKHGKWEKPQWEGIMVWDERAYAQCSVCKNKSYLGWTDIWCRYCGARMDGDEHG